MPTQLQFRRGTTAQNNSFTGAVGEISIDTDTENIRVHDGSQAGGFEIVPSGTVVPYGGLLRQEVGSYVTILHLADPLMLAYLLLLVQHMELVTVLQLLTFLTLRDRVPLGKGSNNSTLELKANWSSCFFCDGFCYKNWSSNWDRNHRF